MGRSELSWCTHPGATPPPMRKVYTSANRMLVGLLSGALGDHGIECIIRNDYLGGGVGDLPAQVRRPLPAAALVNHSQLAV